MLRRNLVWLGAGLALMVAAPDVLAQVAQQAPQQGGGYQQGGGNEYYAAKLGIWYRLFPYGYGDGGGDGYNPNSPPGNPGGYLQQVPYQQQAPVTYGARLSRYPVAGSPCAYLQLEPGDMIVSLDNQPFRGPNDVLSHYGQTSMVFINVRTGQPQTANLNLP